MYHSITFGNKNTWDDWHIVPASRPTFGMPPLKERYVDLPGVDGSIDLTEAVTGYPVYGNRTGSFEFIVMNEWYASDGTYTRGEWQERYSEIANYLHGHTMHAILEDDPQYYYEGRFKLNEWRSEKDYSRIVIEYNVNPYKWLYTTTADVDWLWDPFNFETDIILSHLYAGIAINTNPKTIVFYPEDAPDTSRKGFIKLFGTAPVSPTVTFSVAGNISYTSYWTKQSVQRSIAANTPTTLSDVLFVNQNSAFLVWTNSGEGTVSFDFRPGRL